MRNAPACVPKAQATMVAAALRQASLQPDHASLRATWRHVADQFRPRFPKLAALIGAGGHDVLGFMGFPERHRSKLHSENPLECRNQQVKRRTDVVGIFPNEGTVIRLIGAALMECNGEWSGQTRFMQVEPMTELLATSEADRRQITAEAA